jgi:hypothetical protein
VDDVTALLAVHDVQRTAHLTGDARLMGSIFGDTIREASSGEVRTLTRDQLERRFAESFATRRYLEWSDVQPPIVGVSGSLAWMLVRVHARRVGLDGGALPDFNASWIAIYEKRDDAWTLTAIASSVVELPPRSASRATSERK